MRYILIGAFLVLLCGCSLVPGFLKETKSSAEETVSLEAHSEVLPKVYLIPDRLEDGERVIGVVVANEVHKDLSADANKKTPEVRYTLWQRILRWMMGWGTIAVIAFVALAFVSPTTMATVLAFLKRRWKKVAIETAQGLEAAEIKDKFPTVAEKLEETQSDKTKAVIKDLREDGKL